MFRLLFALSFREQVKLVALAGLLVAERIVRSSLYFFYDALLLVIGKDVLDYLYSKVNWISTTFSPDLDSSKSEQLSPKSSSLYSLRAALYANTHGLLEDMGLECQDYYVDTLDGFTLRLHRIVGNPDGPPILLQHGLMMSSECFVFEKECSLARVLHLNGFDVWLGNNRGNKYSWKHERLSRSRIGYWNFTVDDIARYDVPAMINCVLYFSCYSKVSYIGFSNGCAQIFAAFQDNPNLTNKVAQIVGLAPAVKVRGLITGEDGSATNGMIYPFFFSPESKLFIRCFGNKAWLPSVDQWKRILTPERWVFLLDKAILYMFNWNMTDTCSWARRCKFYYHLYSTTSTRHVHHWMQLIGQQQFVGYLPSSGSFMGDVETMDYDFRIIESVPLTCFVGVNDNLCDREWMKRTFKKISLIEIEGYEHLDFLCHDGVEDNVYPQVVDLLLDMIDSGEAGRDYETAAARRSSTGDEFISSGALSRSMLGVVHGENAVDYRRIFSNDLEFDRDEGSCVAYG